MSVALLFWDDPLSVDYSTFCPCLYFVFFILLDMYNIIFYIDDIRL